MMWANDTTHCELLLESLGKSQVFLLRSQGVKDFHEERAFLRTYRRKHSQEEERWHPDDIIWAPESSSA